VSHFVYLEYGGAPIRFHGPAFTTGGPAEQATQFTSHAEAWHAAHSAGLAPHNCRVVNLAAPAGQPDGPLAPTRKGVPIRTEAGAVTDLQQPTTQNPCAVDPPGGAGTPIL